MKPNILIFLALFLSFVVACQEYEFEPDSTYKAPSNEGALTMDLITLDIAFTPFTEDFRTNNPLRKKGQPPSDLTFKYKGINHLSYDDFKTLYPEVKEDFLDLKTSGKLNFEAHGIQDIGLRILRGQLLEIDSEFAIEESKFLMDLLIETKAVDLDVLADGFIKIKNNITEQKRQLYLNYLKKLYNEDKSYIESNWEDVRHKYLNAKDPKKKRLYLMNGKGLEQRGKALNYAKELIPELENSDTINKK